MLTALVESALLQLTREEFQHRLDIFRVTQGVHTEHYRQNLESSQHASCFTPTAPVIFSLFLKHLVFKRFTLYRRVHSQEGVTFPSCISRENLVITSQVSVL